MQIENHITITAWGHPGFICPWNFDCSRTHGQLPWSPAA